MKTFKHTGAQSVESAAQALNEAGAVPIAGGTDLIGLMKDQILRESPGRLVDLKTIEGLDFIREDADGLSIGALTRLSDIAENPTVQEKFTALAQAAGATASPNLRNMATIGGNVSQHNRCWYFRKEDNRFDCMRKGGRECFAETGDNRYHSVFGGLRPHLSSCATECPAGTDIPGYLALMREGKIDEAATRIMEVNPLPAITSRVCAHFCRTGCARGFDGESVSINSVERALGDHIMKFPERFYKSPDRETGKTAAVVGGGPSGLSAAYYLRKAGLAVTVYDSQEEAGGMLMYAIPPYRLPKELVRQFTGCLKSMGIRFFCNSKIGDGIDPEVLERQYDTVLYATGTWKRPVVGIAGEELTDFGLDFLSEASRWMKGKAGTETLVCGGGNVAMDVAVTAKRLGASKVTLVCLEPRDRMPASAEEIARAEEEGVTIVPSWGMSHVVSEDGKLTGMALKRCISPWDENGAFHPQYDESDVKIIPAETILMAIGQNADLSFLDDKYRIQRTARGLIEVLDEQQRTSRPGVFAGGDVTTGSATVIGAVAGGKRAAKGMLNYLDPDGGGTCERVCDKHDFLHFDAEGILCEEALKLRAIDKEKRRLDLEDSFSPTMDEALAEAKRCRNCGCYSVSPSDTAPALIALDAEMITNRRSLRAEDYFAVAVPASTVLGTGEILTEIRIPAPENGSKSAFQKIAWRKSIDFPVVNCAVRTGDNPRVCLNAVAPVPYRATAAEDILTGKNIDEILAETAGDAASKGSVPFEAAAYKLQLVRTLVKRALLETNASR